MKQLPLVLALGSVFLSSMAAAQSSVQVYGRLYPYINNEKASGATAAGTPVATLAATPTTPSTISAGATGLSSGNSHLGFRGKEELGNGVSAEFQLEGVVGVDDGGLGGFSWNRNTFVGLNGGFGSIKLGLMDTVFKEYGDTIGVLGTSSGTPMSSSNILRKPGFGPSNAARFHERRANSARYDSPEFGGFGAAIQVATQENPDAALRRGPQKTYSVGVKYDNGPIYLALAHEIHDDFFGGSNNAPTAMRNLTQAGITSKDRATQATVEWRITANHKVEFDAIRKEYNENANITGRFQSYSNMAYLAAYEGRFGPWRVAAQYVRSEAGKCSRVNAACITDGLEGSKMLLGAAYNFSRRTSVFAIVDQMKNAKSSRFAANDFGAVNPGEDTRHFIAGVSHRF